MASHLLYTQPGVLRDNVPAERQWGIEVGLTWSAAAEATAVYIDRGISPGMRFGIENAATAGRPIEERRLRARSNESGAASLPPRVQKQASEA